MQIVGPWDGLRRSVTCVYPRPSSIVHHAPLNEEPATLFALADMRRAGHTMLVRCDTATALLVLCDHISVDEAIERVAHIFRCARRHGDNCADLRRC